MLSSTVLQNAVTIQHEFRASTRAEAVDAILQKPTFSTDKEEDYPVCFMHYFNHCSEHLDSNMLPVLLLWTVPHAHWDPKVGVGLRSRLGAMRYYYYQRGRAYLLPRLNLLVPRNPKILHLGLQK